MLFSPFGNYTCVKLFNGVLQGSILGLFLCNVFLNSTFYIALNSTTYNFADDNTVSLIHKILTFLSYDVASESEITPCNKICKPLVVYRFSGNVMTSITTLRI